MRQRSFAANVAWLAIVQGSGYLVPLLSIPYLLRIVGVDGYGKIAFAQAISVYFILATDYGFNYSAARRASVARADKRRLSKLIWPVQIAKLLIAALSVATVHIAASIVPQFEALGIVLGFAMLEVLGAALYPVWLLHGLERMREAAIMMLIIRFSLLGALFIFVQESSQLELAALLTFSGTLLAAAVTWGWIFISRTVAVSRPELTDLVAQLREGWSPFMASLANATNRSGNAVVLGLMAGPAAVAAFSLAEKLVRTTQEISRPISQAAYPRLAGLFDTAPSEAQKLLRMLASVIGVLTVGASATLFLMSEKIVTAVTGRSLAEAILVVQVMAAVPFFSGMNNVLGPQAMLASGRSKEYAFRAATAAALSLALIFPFANYLGAAGAGLTYLVSEAVLFTLLIGFHLKQRTFFNAGSRAEAFAT